MKQHHRGYLVFAFFALLILLIILYSEDKYLKGLISLSDAFTSLLLLFGFVFAFIIYLTNQKIIPVKQYMKAIEKIPDFLPFKHTLKKYFLQFIKKDFKIIVLLRTVDEKNYKWVLNQVGAYNSIMNNPHLNLKEELDIEFLFVHKYTREIEMLISELNTEQYHYIIISSLSAIFKDAIVARERLEERKRESIQIIGALSSIQDEVIEKIINNDDKIIRIFPPDYDEAKTATEFIFSKIKNSICSNEQCRLHKKENNVIVLHNGTYGRAVKDKCELFFYKEFQNLNLNTVGTLSAIDLEDCVQFYSFDLKSTGEFLYDQMEGETLSPFFERWKDANNYFYIVGYEPNISTILNYLDEAMAPYPEMDFSLLFSWTASMKSWRESISKTIFNSKQLNRCLNQCGYYLKLHTLKGVENIAPVSQFSLSIKQYVPNGEHEEVDIEELMIKLFTDKYLSDIENILEAFWSNKNNENNYISIFTIDSIKIAQYTIKHETTLLQSKFKVLQESERQTDILVNGDSINQYSVKTLD